MMNLLKNSMNFCVMLLCIPNSLTMGRHRSGVAEGRERGQSIKVFYSSILFFFFLVGPRFGPNPAQIWQGLTGPAGPGCGGSGPREKNPFSKRAGFGPRVLARGSGPDMEKPGPNPTRCHSYKHIYISSSWRIMNLCY